MPMHRVLVVVLFLMPTALRAATPDDRFPLFGYLTGPMPGRMITYTPSQLDPRYEANQHKLATSSIRADLEALRPIFDGLVLYSYHEACTPRILAVARDLKFRAVLLGVWSPKSAAELDGVAECIRLHEKDFAIGVLIGNEGVTFNRYETEDLVIAAARLRRKVPATIPLATSEPLTEYKSAFFLDFGDFLCPNIHPVFDHPELHPTQAAAWAREQAERLARAAKKPVVLKETGVPHGGRGKNDPYTLQTQKEFWAAYLAPGALEHLKEPAGVWVFHGVAFEAFDLPWKAEASGLLIERYWGLFSQERKPSPAAEVWKRAR
jgi:exo-beta-1,3-glucanase (GH17 family)